MPDASRNPPALPAPAAREAAIQRLSTAFAQDYLSAEEFERRVTEVYRAVTESAVAAVIADLPAATESRPVGPVEAMAARLSSILSSVERGGSLVVPAKLELRSTMGNIVLDLRQSHFQEGVTEIHVRAIMGNIELYLPEGVQVECRGRTFVGHFAHRAMGNPSDPGRRPDRVVLLTGWSILGSVEARQASSANDDAGPRDSLQRGDQ